MSLATETTATFVGGRASVFGHASVGALDVAEAMADTLDVSGNATVGGTLHVTGATSLNNTLGVTGMATFNGQARFNAYAGFMNELHVRGTKAMLHNSLEIKTYETPAPPAISDPDNAWIYYDGTHLKVSQNHGPYINLVGQNTLFGAVTTTNATPTSIIVVPTTSNSAGILEAKVTGQDPITHNVCTISMLRSYVNAAGVVTLKGATATTFTYSDVGGVTADFAVSGTNVAVQVTGELAVSWNWTANVTLQAVP